MPEFKIQFKTKLFYKMKSVIVVPFKGLKKQQKLNTQSFVVWFVINSLNTPSLTNRRRFVLYEAKKIC